MISTTGATPFANASMREYWRDLGGEILLFTADMVGGFRINGN
jgi:hypothetical protein